MAAHGHGHHGHGGQMTPEQQKQMIEQDLRLAKNLGQIKHKIVVMSGKGGVGKSTVAANIAETLQKLGFKTGILDADIHGPNIPKMLGVDLYGEQFNEYQFKVFKEITESGMADKDFKNDEEKLAFIEAKKEEYKHSMFPVVAPSGLKVMSMAFLLDGIDRPIIWRGPQKTGAIKQLISDAHWGSLDYLIIDNPPGTGDEPLTVLQTIPDADAVIMVTTPNVVSQEDVLKCVKMVEMMNIKQIGLIENMAYYICPHCDEKLYIFGEGNGEAFAEEMEITYLGDLPIEEKVSDAPNNEGAISVIDPNDEVSKRFVEIVKDIQKEFIKE
ncbi:MAG: Mrp/NBP35 family ATP-binding protein [archaeon]|uniref:Iron-sulfur cluster carrier protein n=1 Tax=Methanobrevibacter gottschalkii DSM 11977 TaxID=1122229 RepID=A0A3N5B070_9EURY|nr:MULTISPECIES: Mrp/NBP35 family ATP-binding protein [Methanobrevibacter]MCQ2970580.1 Mrp/NBP35 family ATP-binding protein [archaeon]OEC96953.1 ATP-binding protein [Methanobrevibacter sp. A27]RPF50956.1 ATP-binding protein involved in chromosome partitioning [Methanobrevibacter gottschalkii DSM 11977]